MIRDGNPEPHVWETGEAGEFLNLLSDVVFLVPVRQASTTRWRQTAACAETNQYSVWATGISVTW